MARSDALKKRLNAQGAKWMQWRGLDVVADYGDPAREYHAVRSSGLGLVDRSGRDTLVLSGQDAASWLQGLVTSDVRELVREGSGQLSSAVSLIGRLITDMRILHMPEMLLIDLEPGVLGEGFLSHLKRHLITEDVQILDRSAHTSRLGVFGAQAAVFLQKTCSLAHPMGSLAPFEGTWGSLGPHDIVVQRVPTSGGPGYDIACATEEAADVWDLLMQAGELTPVGFETLETLRIEAGVPRYGVELTDAYIPLEAGLNHAISFTKGCYLGQEIIARLDTRGTPAKLLRTLVFEGGAAPELGADVEAEGSKRAVGEVLSSVWSPLLNAPIALAYIKRDHNEIGGELQVEGRPAIVQPLGYALASTRNSV